MTTPAVARFKQAHPAYWRNYRHRVHFVGMLSGLCFQAEAACLSYGGRSLFRCDVEHEIRAGNLPYGLIIQMDEGLFVVTGRAKELLPDDIAWIKLN